MVTRKPEDGCNTNLLDIEWRGKKQDKTAEQVDHLEETHPITAARVLDKGTRKNHGFPTCWMPVETVGLIRCYNMDSRLRGNDGMGMGTDLFMMRGVPHGAG